MKLESHKFEESCRKLEENLQKKKEKQVLSKAHSRLLDVARHRSRKGGRVERNSARPKPYDDLVDLGLLTEDGRYVER
jgi:hypothetical protein